VNCIGVRVRVRVAFLFFAGMKATASANAAGKVFDIVVSQQAAL